MWHLAVAYPASDPSTPAIAKEIWNKLNAIQKSVLGVNFSTLNFIVGINTIVIAYDEDPPPDQVIKRIEQIIPQDHRIVVSDSLLRRLLHRRAERLLPQILTSGKAQYEAHTPSPVRAEEGEAITEEEQINHLRAVIQSMHHQGYPFVDVYQLYAPMNLQVSLQIKEDHIPYFDRNKDIAQYQEQIKQSDKYLFTESARLMHASVFEDDPTWIPFNDNLWIEHDIPQNHIKAIYVYLMTHYVQEETYQIVIIDEFSRHRMAILFRKEAGIFDPTLDYRCPTDECEILYQDTPQGRMVARNPCEACRKEAHYWMAWLHTVVRMLRRDFSVSPDPKPFDKKEMAYKKKEFVPRHHGKGDPKEKWVEKKVQYTLVSYDVSIAPVEKPQREEAKQKEGKENWLTLHGLEDRIYVKREFTGQKRRYRGTHYQRLIQRCLKEGIVREDGYEYKLDKDEDENWMVIGSIADYEKYIPMLRSDLRKSSIVKVVRAKKYES